MASRLIRFPGMLLAATLSLSVASLGQPQMISRLLTQGFDPNSRFSTPANRRVHSSLEGVSIHSYLLDATPSTFSQAIRRILEVYSAL